MMNSLTRPAFSTRSPVRWRTWSSHTVLAAMLAFGAQTGATAASGNEGDAAEMAVSGAASATAPVTSEVKSRVAASKVATIPASSMATPAAAGPALAGGDAAVAKAPSAAPRKAKARKTAHKTAPRGPKIIEECSWDHPGLHPFMGNVVNAIDRYQDIPVEVRARLKERMQARTFDEFVLIEKDNIVGKRKYQPGIREMHFGNGSICRTVTRTKWTPAMHERGLVYCEQNYCILVPTVCRNVSRITRLPEADAPPQASVPPEPVPEEGAGGGGGGGGGSAGWLVVQARQVQESTPVSGSGTGGGVPITQFSPPFAGGLGGSSHPVTDCPLPLDPISSVPEPQTWMMYGAGLAGLVVMARRRKRRA